jgi:uncharacterized membrane protein
MPAILVRVVLHISETVNLFDFKNELTFCVLLKIVYYISGKHFKTSGKENKTHCLVTLVVAVAYSYSFLMLIAYSYSCVLVLDSMYVDILLSASYCCHLIVAYECLAISDSDSDSDSDSNYTTTIIASY